MPQYLAIVVKDEETTESGIVLSAISEKEKPTQGKIINVGGQDHTFEVGQEILFEKYGAFEIEVDKEKIHIIDKQDVIGILK